MPSAQNSIILANLSKPIDLRLARELSRAGVTVTAEPISLAYAACKALKPAALVYFAANDEVEADFDPELRRITRDFRHVLVYVVSSDLSKRLTLLADDHVEAVFPRSPKAEHLTTISDLPPPKGVRLLRQSLHASAVSFLTLRCHVRERPWPLAT